MQTEVTIAFSIAYRGKNPVRCKRFRNVGFPLFGTKSQDPGGPGPIHHPFLETELKQLQERIKGLGEKITAFKEQHDGLLPEQQGLTSNKRPSGDGH